MRTALQFSRKGHTVFASMRDTSISGELEKAAKDENLSVEIVQLDVTDDTSIQRATAEVIAKAGGIEVLINNAGFGFFGPLEEADMKEAKLVFETNFFGPLRLIQAVLPGMREQGAGTIVNVSSLSGVIAEPYNGIYAASKHALEAMSESLYYESHPFGVRVLIVEPGGHDTRGYWRAREERRLSDDSPHFEYGTRFMEAVTKRLPGAATPGDPQEVADAIYDAVYDDEPKLRYMVGKEKDVAMLRRQLDDAEFEQAMRTTLDIWD
jgi:NAD(P)-dependent dehydrogenase (short-subunit alcohol dehydrogenase family)